MEEHEITSKRQESLFEKRITQRSLEQSRKTIRGWSGDIIGTEKTD